MKRVEVNARRCLLNDFFKVDEAQVSFECFDGSMTPPVRRLVFERGDSVAAVVCDPDACLVFFTEQFRFPTLEKGPGWLIEVIAGMVEAGEEPGERPCAAKSKKNSASAPQRILCTTRS